MSANDPEQLSALIGDIYDASLDASLWVGVLRSLAAYIGGNAAVLANRDMARRTGNSTYLYNVDDACKAAYFETYIKLDPTLIGYNLTAIGEAFSTTDFITYAEFVETRFYREWVVPRGWVDSVGTVLHRSSESSTILSVFRTPREGLADASAKRRVRLVAPHLRRAALIGNLMSSHENTVANLSDALDGLGAGVFLVDAAGRLLHANAAGAAVLDRGDPLRMRGGRLGAPESGADNQLRDVFASAGRGRIEGDLAIGTEGIAIPVVAERGELFVAHILPLTAGARRSVALDGAAVAAVFLTHARADTPSAGRVIAEAYKLTPAELRVLLALVDVGGVPEVAAELGSAETTVKWHLRNVFEKTGARRQADLVKLVAGFVSPMAR